MFYFNLRKKAALETKSFIFVKQMVIRVVNSGEKDSLCVKSETKATVRLVLVTKVH